MTRISILLAIFVATLATATPMKAQPMDVRTAQEALMRGLMEDIARQRAHAREDGAALQKELSDFSRYGTPVEGVPRQSQNSSSELHCQTMNMGDGNSVTDCF